MQTQIQKTTPGSNIRLVTPGGDEITTTREKLMHAGFGLREIALIATPSESYWQNMDADVYAAAVACGVQAIGNYSHRKIKLSATHPGQGFTFTNKRNGVGVYRRVASLMPLEGFCHYKATGEGQTDGKESGDVFVRLVAGNGQAAI